MTPESPLTQPQVKKKCLTPPLVGVVPVVCLAQTRGVPVPEMASGLCYLDSYCSARLPQNLTQAHRDAFGAHTYQRRDDPEGAFHHTDWL